jgi:hypothetical protein
VRRSNKCTDLYSDGDVMRNLGKLLGQVIVNREMPSLRYYGAFGCDTVYLVDIWRRFRCILHNVGIYSQCHNKTAIWMFWTSNIIILLRLLPCNEQRSFKSFKAQWFLYVPPGLTVKKFKFCAQSTFKCFVWISEQSAIISLHRLFFITETENVYCAVRTGSLNSVSRCL